jgi:hypothetical protein
MPNSWRDSISFHPAAEFFPLMGADELKALGADIMRNGLIIPVVFWKDQKHFPPVLIDGRNRLDAMEAAGINIRAENDGTDGDPHITLWMRTAPNEMWFEIPRTIIRGDKSGDDPSGFVIGANIHRRHLTAEQRRDLIAKVLRATPGKSNRQIADETKSNRNTVGQIRKKLETSGDVSRSDTRTDRKGRQQPASKPKSESESHLTVAATRKITKIAQAQLDAFLCRITGLADLLECIEQKKPEIIALGVQAMADRQETWDEVKAGRDWLNRLLAMSKAKLTKGGNVFEDVFGHDIASALDKAKAEALR